MFRDVISMIMVTAAAGLPFAIQARLETAPAAVGGATAASALIASTPVEPAVAGSRTPSRFKRSPDGMFYVTASIHGRPIRFLVDTGASIVILSSADARAAGMAGDAVIYGDSVATVAGAARVARTRIDAMEVAGRRIAGLEAAIVEDGVGVSLLGHNALDKFDLLSIEGDELILR